MQRKIFKCLILVLYFSISLYIIDFSIKNENNTYVYETSRVSYSNLIILKIPKINLLTKVIKANESFNNLNSSLVYYKDFNPNNKIIIFGHSGMGKGTYFNRLDELLVGDVAYLEYNKKTYKYDIVRIYNVFKEDTYILKKEDNSKKILLVTCTKDNKNKRLVVELILKGDKTIEK